MKMIGKRQPVTKVPSLDTEDGGRIKGPMLLLEVGVVATRATLVDLAQGKHRFVASGIAKTSASPAGGDVLTGIRQAVGRVERTARRRLLETSGLIHPERRDGGGLNAAVMTASLPLRAALLVPSGSPSVGATRTALAGSNVVVIKELDLEAVAKSGRSALGGLFDLLKLGPDVLIVLGQREPARDRSTLDVSRWLASAYEHSVGRRPEVLSIGTAAQTARLNDRLGKWIECRGVDPAQGGLAGIRAELHAIWQDRLDAERAGYGVAQSWASCPSVPTVEGFAAALRFLALRRGGEVWGVDLGSVTSSIVRATPTGVTIHLVEIGAGQKVRWLLEGDRLGEVLPGGDPERLRDALWNRSLRPWASPETEEELAVSRAVMRETIREVCRRAGSPSCAWRREVGLIVVRGGGALLASQSAAGVAAIVEGLGAKGVFEVALDEHEMLPGLGALAAVSPQAAAEVVLADGLTTLATVALGEGRTRPNEPSARVEVRNLEGVCQQADVPGGTMVPLLLAGHEAGDLTLSPARGVDFGWGGKQTSIQVRGGSSGLLVGVRDLSTGLVRLAGDGALGGRAADAGE